MSDLKRDMSITQLKNMFFNTFGIVPLSYYNVEGDGITDNRLQIQQAINDAIAEGIKYIFVEKGEYYYSLSLRDTDKVQFIGNSVEAIIKDVNITQFPDNYIQIPVGGIILYEGDNIPVDYELYEAIEAPQNLKYIKKVR